MPEKNETNKVRLIGEVISEFTFNHEVFGEKFYFVSLSVTRLSGQVDVIPISISERLMDMIYLKIIAARRWRCLDSFVPTTATTEKKAI